MTTPNSCLARVAINLFCLTMLFISDSHAASTIIPEVNARVKKDSRLQQQPNAAETFHLTQKEIKKSPVINLAELLKQEQSVIRLTNNSGDSSQTALSIRGFGDNAAANSLILVDGFPLTNPSILTPNFNSIALTDIDHIEIIQGSQGSLWGDQAVGGVVNIITRHPKKFIGDINLGAGSFNKTFYNAFVGSHFENGFFFKGFGYTNRTDNYRHHNQQTDDAASVQLGFDYARGMLALNMQANDDTIEFPGGLTQAQYDANPRQATNFINDSHLKMRTYQLLNKQEITSDWLLETRIAHQVLNGDGFMFSPFQRREQQSSIQPRLIGNFYHNKIILGISAQRSDYQLTNSRSSTKANAQQQNLYTQIVIPLIKQVDITLGGRYAWQDNTAEKIINQPSDSTNHVFVTEQGITYHLHPAWQFFLRRDGNFRFPKANEITWISPGSPALQAQTGVSYESGVIWQTEKHKTQLNVYQLQLHDEIAFDPTQTADAPFGTFRNFDDTIRRGITLAETLAITPVITIDSQINYVDARFHSGAFSGKHIPAVPALNANAGVSYQLNSRWQTKYTALYTGSSYASEDVANVGKQLPGYWLNSIAIQYMLPSFSASFEVNNVFNQPYSTYTLFDPTSQTLTYYPGAGRNFLLTLKANID